METIVALFVPEAQAFFRVVETSNLANTAAVGTRLGAESAIVTEATWARRPADGTHAVEAILAERIAEGAVLLFVSGARGDGLANTTTVGLQPA